MTMPASHSNPLAHEEPNHLHARFTVENHNGLRESPDGGLFLYASRMDLGDEVFALALVADLSGVDGGRNGGISATNAIDDIVDNYSAEIQQSFQVRDIVWVELDSMGSIDYVVNRGRGRMEWHPLLSGVHDGRTTEDFTLVYGDVAVRALRQLRRTVAHSPGR